MIGQAFIEFSPTTLADVLTHEHVMDFGIHPLWQGMPRIAGPAFPVRCAHGDNLMVHAAIHRAPAGSILVIQAGDTDFAVAGGNVCRVAQKNGIAGFVIDGVIRDIAEIRQHQFPVFARGLSPIPGKKEVLDVLNGTVICGGVEVNSGDIIVADEEGIVVIPSASQDAVFSAAQAKALKDDSETLEAWEANHRTKIDAILKAKGLTE